MKEQQTDVLVVGAGPVGLLTAILLAESGVEVEIIDREERTAAHSYACALHPATLELLDQLGLTAGVLEQGRRIHAVAFYDRIARQAHVDLTHLGGEFPFLLVVPQSALEKTLEQRLKEKSGISVRWNRRLDDWQSEDDSILAKVEELEGTSLGYIVPHWETVVKKVCSVRARFLVGADGHNSLVRKRLGIGVESFGPPQAFVACEFSSETVSPDELRVVLDETTTNVLWPLPENRFRWTFQLVHGGEVPPFPEKERRTAHFGELAVTENIRHNLNRLTQLRAPWFSAIIQEILWCKQVSFEHQLAQSLGQGRCWLVGDAAHQTGPVGVQSLNAGLLEAQLLATSLQKVVKEEASLKSLARYNTRCREPWLNLLGGKMKLRGTGSSRGWLESRCDRILPCLPGFGDALPPLIRAIGLEAGSLSIQTVT